MDNEVYVVVDVEYFGAYPLESEEVTIIGVFDSKEKAREVCRLNPDYSMVAYELNKVYE